MVVFGPSPSLAFAQAVRFARRHFETYEQGPDRYAVKARLEADRGPYMRLYQLLHMVGRWKATLVETDGGPEADGVVRSMAFCAADWLRAARECREVFFIRPWAKCFTCPLLSEAERHPDRVPDTIPPDW